MSAFDRQHEALASQLAELEERQAEGKPAGESTVAGLKSELDTFVAQLRRPATKNQYEHESACARVTEMVQAIGRDPDELSDQTIDRPGANSAETNKPSATAETPLGNLGVYELQTKLGEG